MSVKVRKQNFNLELSFVFPFKQRRVWKEDGRAAITVAD